MLYKELQVGETTYKLRLSASACVEVEKRLGGKSVLSILMSMKPKNGTDGEVDPTTINMPLISDIVTILHGALQKYQHDVDINKAFDIYDEYIDAGGSYTDFFGILQGVLEVSGFLPKAAVAPQAEETTPAA